MKRNQQPAGRRILREPAVRQKTGLGHDSIWRLGRERRFPRPVKLSTNAVGWFEDEIDSWLEGLAAKRDADTSSAA